MLFWILKWSAVAFGAWFLWGLRNWMRAPWATYVEHTKLKNDEVFLKVKRLSQWPPWLEYTEVWFGEAKRDYSSSPQTYKWYREADGASSSCEERMALTAMFVAAEARKREVDEILDDRKSDDRPRRPPTFTL